MYKGKIVEIHRYFSLLDMQQDDPEVKAWLAQAFRAIGPYYVNKAPASGLTFAEQKILMPIILQVEPEDKSFRARVETNYHEFMTKVPTQGIKLQISLENDNEELSVNNLPVNIGDYVAWKHIIGHPDVAPNKEEAEKLYGKKFYIHDPEGVSKQAVKINDLEDKAYVVYMKYKDDFIKVDQILTMLGVDIRSMGPNDKVIKLKEFAQKTPGKGETDQKDSFERFIKTAEDKDLEYKYLIQEGIAIQYLKRVGNNIVYNESGKQIGVNMDDAVLYFRNPKNSRELNLLKAEYQVKLKRGEAYLPKDNPEQVTEKKEETKTV